MLQTPKESLRKIAPLALISTFAVSPLLHVPAGHAAPVLLAQAAKRGKVSLTGTVTKDPVGNDFWIKTDNGQGYLISTRTQPRAVDVGSRVRVTGFYDGTRVTATAVSIVASAPSYPSTPSYPSYPGSGNNGGANSGYGRVITVSGVVTREPGNGYFFMKGDNGTVYFVTSKIQQYGMYAGVRVQVTGLYDGNTLAADRVTLQGNHNANGTSGARYLTVRGVITKDKLGNQFYMRSDQGDGYLVTTNRQPANATVGTYISVAGWFDGTQLNANTIQILNTNKPSWDYSGRNITVSGVVTRDNVGQDFYMRGDDNKNYLVVSQRQPNNIYPGVRVRVTGLFDGNFLNANSIVVEGNSNGNGNNGARYMTVNGVVTKDRLGNDFFMRGEDGNGYLIVSRYQTPGVGAGARVRVSGYYDGYQINANRVDLVGNSGGGNNSDFGPANKTFYGQITRIGSPYRFDVRSDNGQNISINAVDPLPNRVNVGARVYIQGQDLGNNIVRAVKVTPTTANNRPTVGDMWRR